MYSVKQNPDLSLSGAITSNIKVENGQLIIMHDSDRVVFDGSHWTINGVSQGDGWFNVNIDGAQIINSELAERVLEKVEG